METMINSPGLKSVLVLFLTENQVFVLGKQQVDYMHTWPYPEKTGDVAPVIVAKEQRSEKGD